MRLAVVCTHPVQYHSPWFRFVSESGIGLRVFYLWDFGVTDKRDPGFGHTLRWDVPLLDGHEHEFVPNVSSDPGTHHFWGMQNPALIERLSAYGPDAILMLGFNYASLIGLLLSRPFWNVPIILRGDSHRLIPDAGINARLKTALRRALFRRFSAFLHVGRANREYYQAVGVPDSRLFFAPHAVDNQRFLGARVEANIARETWRTELGFKPRDVVFLFAGKLEVKKRPDLLLEAFTGLANSSAGLLFVGAGVLERALKDRARTDSRVKFVPFQNQSRMPAVYALGEALVLPSQGASETWGLCVNEAMCMERPVIVSSNVGCAPDLVRHGFNGLIFPAGDVAALRACLQQVLDNPSELAIWGQRGRKMVEAYSYEAATKGLVNALEYVTRH